VTITEVAIVGKPAIFVPLPSMSANRQEDNARVLEKIGAAKMILNKELNGDILASQIDDIIFDRVELEEMGRIAMTVAPKDVEEKIYEEIKKVVK
jgi:UDP-N-acetylglucosamine--N-acetylmuramyl-(pentapeptide) pyrophosphoryl-undecaprenol N-acetylglucosamine transferase